MWHVRRGVGTPHVRATCRRVPKTRQNLEIKEYTCYKGQNNALSTQKVFAKKKILRLKRSTGAFFSSRYNTTRKTTGGAFLERWTTSRPLLYFFFCDFFDIFDPPPHWCSIFSNKVCRFKRRRLVKGLRFFLLFLTSKKSKKNKNRASGNGTTRRFRSHGFRPWQAAWKHTHRRDPPGSIFRKRNRLVFCNNLKSSRKAVK